MSESESASAADLVPIRALLEASGLPTSDLASARPEFAVIRERGQVVAAGALQRYGSSALLRSVVVTAAEPMSRSAAGRPRRPPGHARGWIGRAHASTPVTRGARMHVSDGTA